MKLTKYSNRSIILNYLFRNSPVARIDIANQTFITPATVSLLTKEMMNEGIINEVGDMLSTNSGRRPILIDFIPNSILSIGLEFTEKGIFSCICNEKGVILHKISDIFSPESEADINNVIIKQINQLISLSEGKKLIGVGIGVPGHISTDRKKLITNRKIWKNFSPELIRTSFSLPISFENNVRCMSYSKYLFDSSETPENFSYFHIGPGLYCSNFINGECLVGGSYLSGEIGHTIVSSSGPRCECGKYACLQTFASERWLIKYAKLQYENSSFSILNSLVKNSEEINISHITTAYSMGDVLIRNSISTALKYLGNSISNIAILLNPDKIFLHSELFNNEEIKSELLSLINEQLLFVDSEYSHNIILLPYSPFDGAVGAAAYSMNEHFILKNYN